MRLNIKKAGALMERPASCDRLAADHGKLSPARSRRQPAPLAPLTFRIIRGDHGEFQGLERAYA